MIAGTLAAMPAWVGAWINPVGGGGPLAAIVNGAQDYDFDTAPQIVDWLLLRALATGWLNVMQAAAAPGNIDQRGVDARTRFAAVEQQRALFATAGGAGPAHGAPLAGVAPNFTLFGRGYVVALSGPNHYYAHHGGAAIQYSAGAFSRANASAVVDHLVAHGAATPYPGPQSHVDEFVCAFLAEPTRWPADQAFNMLAITSGANAADQMTGADLAGTLPMAAGTTWSAINQVVGRNLPKRALEHANREGIRLIIDQELPPSTSQNNFALRVMRQLGLLQ